MAYKTIVQTIIIFLIFLTVILFMNKYFKKNKSQELERKIETKLVEPIPNNSDSISIELYDKLSDGI